MLSARNMSAERMQSGPAYIDENGELHDWGLHDDMLNNPQADATFNAVVREQAKAKGMSDAEIDRFYGGSGAFGS